MRKDLTDITLVVDRSGSMQARQDEAQGGVNALIKKQRKGDGEANLTLIQFDTEYEVVHNGVPIGDVGKYELQPRGMTALLDAVGKAINEAKSRIKDVPKAERPGLTVFVIVTDGMENASHEFTKEAVKALVEKQQDKKGWQFIFLGADIDAFAGAGSMGINLAGAAVMDSSNYVGGYLATDGNISRMRGSTMRGEMVMNVFTDEERKKMAEKKA